MEEFFFFFLNLKEKKDIFWQPGLWRINETKYALSSIILKNGARKKSFSELTLKE